MQVISIFSVRNEVRLLARISNTKLLNEVKNFRASQDIQIDALDDLSKSFSDAQKSTNLFKDNLTSINNLIHMMINLHRTGDVEKSEKDRATVIKEDSSRVSHAMRQLESRFIELAKTVADTANRYSQISNDLITVTGASGRDVRNTRTEIVQDVIKQINRETGNFLNPEKSYQKVVDIANQANIGNLEAIEAITRPMLIASETMNIKNNELASLFNKWYTRYNFSSAQMEDMVDEIRGNTAGNNATAAASMENISKFQNFIGVYADSTEEMQNMVEAISQESARLESVGINSGYIFDYMKQIGVGDMSNSRAIMSLLNNSGTGLNWTEAQRLLRSGDADSMKLVSDALAKGAQAIGDKLKDSTMTAEALKVYGLDVEEIYNILSASGILMNSDDFMKSVSGTQSAIESLDDKFNTHSDKFNNIFSGVSEHFANFQEEWGIGISDLLKIAGLIYSAILLRNSINRLSSGNIPNIGATSSIGSRLLNSKFGVNQWVNTTMTGEAMGLSGRAATLAGSALTVGGVTAGGLLAVDGIKGAFDEGASTASRVSSTIEATGGIAGAGLLVGLGASNPAGWIALAIGGAAFLTKKYFDNANALSGNAEKVSEEIQAIGDSLKEENNNRIKQVSELSYQFNQASTLEDKKQLMLNSGLFSQEELRNKEEDQLKEMIDSYKEAAGAMNSVTDQVLGIAEKYAKKDQDKQQKNFISRLEDIEDSEDRLLALNLLKGGIKDEKLLDKIEKAIEDGKITQGEWNDIINGGKDAWFDDHTIKKQAVDTDFMNLVSGYFDWNKSYSDSSAIYTAAKLYASLAGAGSKKEFENILDSIEDQDLEGVIENLYGDDIISSIKKSKGYAVGSNYIERDQIARIHEGEAVVPKKYNPSANVTELEMLRRYYRESTNRENAESIASMREIVSAIREIKEFLSHWKDDNNRREDINKSVSRLSSTDFISRYLPSY